MVFLYCYGNLKNVSLGLLTFQANDNTKIRMILPLYNYFKLSKLFIAGLPFKDCNTDGTWYRHPETQFRILIKLN
jgi:hypothetical protein